MVSRMGERVSFKEAEMNHGVSWYSAGIYVDSVNSRVLPETRRTTAFSL